MDTETATYRYLRNLRIFDALSFIRKGVSFAFRAMKGSRKEEIQNLEQAVEEIEKGLGMMKRDLDESKREFWKAEYLPPRARHPSENLFTLRLRGGASNVATRIRNKGID